RSCSAMVPVEPNHTAVAALFLSIAILIDVPLPGAPSDTPGLAGGKREGSLAMAFTVRLFGPMAMVVGSDHVQVSVEGSPPTCAALRRELASQLPALRTGLDQCRFAVNHEYVAE